MIEVTLYDEFGLGTETFENIELTKEPITLSTGKTLTFKKMKNGATENIAL